MLKSTVRDRKIAFNPAVDVTPPTPQKPDIKYWSRDEAQKFLSSARGIKYYIYILIALSTGMGRSEILSLHWKNVDLKEKLISVKQTLVATKDGPLLQDAAKTENRIWTLTITDKLKGGLLDHQERKNAEIKALGLHKHPGLF